MRPTGGTGVEATLRPRKHSNEASPTVAPSTGPTSFFLASEADLVRRGSGASATHRSPSPVQTWKEAIEDTSSEPKSSPNRVSVQSPPRRDGSRRRSTIRPKSIEDLRYDAIGKQHPTPAMLTPSLPTSHNPSLPSSPKSLSSRSLPKSEEDGGNDGYSSQAIESEDEGEADNAAVSAGSLQDSAPQLIMPSIRMPSRRPFTDRGKNLGKIKIMVVGARGSGKTSLIKSIVQSCEDIVHVDPLTSSMPSKSRAQSKGTVNAFNETFASTKPYPRWWSDMDDSRVLKRRKSMGDAVLERNICFVDTSHNRSPAFAASYIEQQLHHAINCANQATGELTSLLSGKGGTQVDLVLYLVSHASLDDDCHHIQQLSRLANVVPLISKSDMLTPEQLTELRTSISSESSFIPRLPIDFASTFSSDGPQHQASAPFAVSCVNGPDFDNMDASLLMSSEYIQPLLPSELSLLVDQIFSPENIAYFRHTAAKKLIAWYTSGSRIEGSVRTPSPGSVRVRSPVSSALNSPLDPSLAASAVLLPVTSHSELSLNTSNSFALAKVADHTQKEERLAQIRLSKWASDLQLSLQRERERYENLARSQRAVWLVERMGEEIREGQLVPASEWQSQVTESAQNRRGKKLVYRDSTTNLTYQAHDPLGLLRWQDTIRAQTWLALQVVGSFGVVGGLALWITKQWGYDSTFHQWARDWGLWHD